jgi:FAD dependent monooxygenase
VKERIRLSTKVTDIKTSEKNVTVTTASGTVYNGHLVVGADGVHSPVRSAMWAQADRENPGLFPRQERYGKSRKISEPAERRHNDKNVG